MIKLSHTVIEQTLAHLREAGTRRNECVVLWLGKSGASEVLVTHCYRPIQFARADQFRIPQEGMDALRVVLRRDRLMVAAQVHSHPAEAFHSEADDEWAILRHLNALSLVVPRFAFDTTGHNFLDQTKVYQFSDSAKWIEVPSIRVTDTCLQIV
jgi:proteasome lid subunit RPN8/RPN11